MGRYGRALALALALQCGAARGDASWRGVGAAWGG